MAAEQLLQVERATFQFTVWASDWCFSQFYKL